MPAFKPKFSVSSQKPIHKKQALASNSTKLQSEVESDQIIPAAILKDSSKSLVTSTSTKACDNADITMELNCNIIAQSEAAEIEDRNKISSLTEKQYDDVIEAVVQKAAAGVLFIEANECDVDAVKKCLDETSVSANIVKLVNEKTPTSSPIDRNSSSVKLLKQKPVKKKCEPRVSIPSKRKSLKYLPSSSSMGEAASEDKNKKIDSEILTHRKKVLNKGVWVQCDNEICMKWRYLQHYSDPSVLPKHWNCSMNTDDNTQNKCSDPELDWSSCMDEDNDHFIYTDYNAGSIVWARLPGYPAWPAMVDSDPDTYLFYDYDSEGKVHSYHVVFLDDQVSRAWVSAKSIKSYTHNSSKQLSQYKVHNFHAELQNAISQAEEALQLSLEQRLEKYNFEKRYLASGKCQKWTTSRRAQNKSCNNKSKQCNQVVPDGAECKLEEHKKSVDIKNRQNMRQKASRITSHTESAVDKLPMQPSHSAHHGKVAPRTVSQASNVPKLKPKKQPVKPSFKAHSRVAPTKAFEVPPKPKCCSSEIANTLTPKMCNSPPPAVVPSASPEKPSMKFDPDIYTMELSGQEKNQVKYDNKNVKPSEHNVSDTKLNSLPFKNDDDFAKDFWQPQEVKMISIDSEDPFADLDMSEMGEDDWGDEEMKQLDELMPVITDHLSATMN